MKKQIALALVVTGLLLPSLVQARAVTYADLQIATPSKYDGSQYFCGDCTATSVCGSGGTGAIAIATNGVWNCGIAGGSFNGGSITSGISISNYQLLDNFTRANTALGQLGSADSGQPWLLTGPNLANAQILNHAMQAVLGTTQFYAYTNLVGPQITQLGAVVKWVAGSGSGTGTIELIETDGVSGTLTNMAHTVNGGVGNAPTITWWQGVSTNNFAANCTNTGNFAVAAVGDIWTISITLSGNHILYQQINNDGSLASEDCEDSHFPTAWSTGVQPVLEMDGQAGHAINPTVTQTWASTNTPVTAASGSASFPVGITGPIGQVLPSVGSFTGVKIGPATGFTTLGKVPLSITTQLSTSAIVPHLLIDNPSASAPVILLRNTQGGGAALGCIDWSNDTTTTVAPFQICVDTARQMSFTRAGVEFLKLDSNGNVIASARHIVTSQTTFNGGSCGTSPTFAGTDNNGQVMVGTGPGTCTITYRNAYTTAPSANPICISNSGGTMTVLPCTSNTTTLTLNPGGVPAIVAGDILTWVSFTGK